MSDYRDLKLVWITDYLGKGHMRIHDIHYIKYFKFSLMLMKLVRNESIRKIVMID